VQSVYYTCIFYLKTIFWLLVLSLVGFHVHYFVLLDSKIDNTFYYLPRKVLKEILWKLYPGM